MPWCFIEKRNNEDVTLPTREGPLAEGRIHPVSQVTDEITEIFADMGFSIAEGPDIETDDYNFTKLNFPEGHPAREMHDTFFMKPGRKARLMARPVWSGPSCWPTCPSWPRPAGPGP